jgi:catalase-peroxidase
MPILGGALNETAGGGTNNLDWWPNHQFTLWNVLRQNSALSNPMDVDFDMPEFKSLDLAQVKKIL